MSKREPITEQQILEAASSVLNALAQTDSGKPGLLSAEDKIAALETALLVLRNRHYHGGPYDPGIVNPR